jgi:4'-phosphopantetheinyl transferase
MLSPDERARAGRLVFPRDRHRFTAGRAFLRGVLALYQREPPAALRFRYGTYGKPELDVGEAEVRFNLAHADDLAVCAITTGGDVGVDVERLRPLADAEGVAAQFFSARERAALFALPRAFRQRAFFDAWTRKEAFLKALGSGLARPLDGFDVTLGPGEPPLLRTVENSTGAERFTLCALEPAPGFVAAVAVRARDCRLRTFQWSWAGEQPREVVA